MIDLFLNLIYNIICKILKGLLVMNNDLFSSYDKITDKCFEIFEKKQKDYGPTWILNRYSSLIDEIWRKAKRIRTLEENGEENALINEGRDVEYLAIINYCVMCLIRLGDYGLPADSEVLEDLSKLDSVTNDQLFTAYKSVTAEIRELLYRKNNDYGDAWRSMGIYSMTDQVLIRVYRIKTILSNGGKCEISEGVDSQLKDIINYCVFALIKLAEAAEQR